MDKSEVDSYVKAGEIAKQVKVFVKEIVEHGKKLIDIAEAIDAKILDLGGKAAFPVNLSLNEIAAHYTPALGDETLAEGLLKIDIGVVVDGFIADTAMSVDLTEDGRFGEMIRLNEEMLKRATDAVRVGMEIRDIGEACQNSLEEWGSDSFAVIKSLSGHSLGKDSIHAGVTISNYRNDNETVLDGIAFAIEPFVTSGVGDIFEGKGGGIYTLKGDGRVRDRDARLILEFIRDEYSSLPFCERAIARARDLIVGEKWSPNKLRFALTTLVRQGILYEYPMLIEKSRKPVSQIENTFVVADGEVICTTG